MSTVEELKKVISTMEMDYSSLKKKYDTFVKSNYITFDSTLKRVPQVTKSDWSEDDITDSLKGENMTSQTLEINEAMKKMIKEKGEKSVFKFGFGESPFPIPDVVIKSLQNYAHLNSYTVMNGREKLRVACVRHMKEKFSCEIFEPSNVMVGIGSKTILGDVQRILKCEILITSPSWVTYLPQSIVANRKYRLVKCNKENSYFPTADAIEELCKNEPNKRRLLIMNSPSNPTGCRMTLDQCKAIVPVLRKYKIILLSDEIYALFHEDGKKPICMAQPNLYPELTIVTNGLSKVVGAGGWRLGFGCFPPKLSFMVKYLRKLASNSFSCAPEPIQMAAITALEQNDEVDVYLRNCRKILDVLRNWCYERFKKIGVELPKPDSAFYMFPDFGKYREKLLKKFAVKDSVGMCKVFLKNTGVAVLPGKAFRRDGAELTCRVCLCDFKGGEALKAAAVLFKDGKKIGEEFLKKYCTKMVKGFDKLCDFLTSL